MTTAFSPIFYPCFHGFLKLNTILILHSFIQRNFAILNSLFILATSFTALSAKKFGKDFQWGVAIAAAQNEGASSMYGRGQSVWDMFARNGNKIKGKHKPTIACDFYHCYKDDLLLTKALGFAAFRFSISWSRILPDGTGKINKEGIDFYH